MKRKNKFITSVKATEILIRHYQIVLPLSDEPRADQSVIVTILNNLVYYGYALSETAYSQLIKASLKGITTWWLQTEAVLRKITGDHKNMTNFVVYKNFPQEVLNMSETQYWCQQILMYWGFPKEYFTETVVKRPPLNDRPTFKILHPADDNSLLRIFEEILYLPNRWTDEQWENIVYLLNEYLDLVDTNKIQFKENLIKVLMYCLEEQKSIKVKSATDVLRLAVGLSGGDISLKILGKFRSFKRQERRFILGLLNNTPNLDEDVYRRKNVWKKLMYSLHPGDYKTEFIQVVIAYNQLFHNLHLTTFNNHLESLLEKKDIQVLELLKTRPGEFVRRLHSCINLFGQDAVIAFETIIPQLKIIQLVKLQSYLETINYRLYRTFAPHGNWTKMQIFPTNEKRQITSDITEKLLKAIAQEIKKRINPIVPLVKLDPEVNKIKLQTNDSDLTPYGRGTKFPIPDQINFIRTASYWRSGPTEYNIWYDNSWNFFDSAWNPLGTCCWNFPFYTDGAIFSGDPTNSKDLEGNACQLIDLYLDNLRKIKVRYAMWNILCYSRLSFDVAEEVYAAFQWGEDPFSGQLFEPSRCQFSFPIKGKNFTKYIAVIDLQDNVLIYLDANLYGSVSSANENLETLHKNMPAFMEYLDTLPSIFDLFKHQERGENGLCIAYSDQNLSLKNNEEAYIFRPENKDNQFTSFSLNKILNL